MPAAAAVVVAGGIAAYASNKASNTSAKSSDAAINFQKDQEAERKREYDAQVAGQKAKYEALNKLAIPYRMAGASVLAKYGFRAPADAPAAPFNAPAMPPDWKPGDQLPGHDPTGGAPPIGMPPPSPDAPMMGAPVGPVDPAMIQGMQGLNLSNIGDWTNWQHAGVRR